MQPSADLVGAWRWGASVDVVPIPGGLINTSYRVERAGAPIAALQRLNTSIFRPEVHFDIDAVTGRLAERGVETPRLLPTSDGRLWAEAADGGVWRALTWHGERTFDKVGTLDEARSAGALVARFHAAVDGFDWDFRHVRPGAHDTDAHMAGLRAAVSEHVGHRLAGAVRPLADEILGRWADHPGASAGPERVIHGDLKISNIRFVGARAATLIDLDTFQRGTLQVELGDAMRSWCNRAAEDAEEAALDEQIFAAALHGYAEGWRSAGGGPSDHEWDEIATGLERIALELASRFARDALEERYFGFNPRFGGRGEHNLVRARGQLVLARRAAVRRAALHERVLQARG